MDTSAWKIDDKEWMKQRKEEWKKVKFSVEQLGGINRKEMTLVKNYFLYGDTKDKETPIELITYSLLLQTWLHADTSLENMLKLKEDYLSKGELIVTGDGSWQVFSSYAVKYDLEFKTDKSFFCGLEEKLYNIFSPKELKRENYKKESNFLKKAKNKYLTLCSFYGYFSKKEINSYNIIKLQLPIWKQSIEFGYQERPELPIVIYFVEKALSEPEQFQEHQVNLAKELIEVFNDQEMPEPFRQGVKEARYKIQHDDEVKNEIKFLMEQRK